MKAFSVVSWNVEHFQNDLVRVDRVVELLNLQSADIFALYEVQGADVYNALVNRMPGYTFHITEGKETQEILLGVRHGITAFFTQKLEFRSGVTTLRPGALLSVKIFNENYSLLFLHTASGNDPRGLGLRDDMLFRACKFRKTMDKAYGGKNKANYIFLGDFNIMGMKYPYVRGRNITPANELEKLSAQAIKFQMRVLSKDSNATWCNGSHSSLPPSDLDHVVASQHLQFNQINGCDISVRGWPKETSNEKQDEWIKSYSDHGLLYFEVQNV